MQAHDELQVAEFGVGVATNKMKRFVAGSRSLLLATPALTRNPQTALATVGRRQIGNVVINNPPVNTLTKETLQKLTADIKALEKKGEKAFILTSPNRVFSAGLDLKAFAVGGEKELREYWLAFIAALRTLYNTPLLTVAAISRHSPAGGCIMSLCCDYRVIAKDAKIGE
jgi:enoyl-CoA hydratase/carnithine racemase